MLSVEILNPETVENLYRNHGEFARVCYDTPAEQAERVGRNCERSGHMSGSRCEYIKFYVRGVDRGTAEQCLRHEIGVRVPTEMQDSYCYAMDTVRNVTVSPDEIVKNMASFRYIGKDNFEYETPSIIKEDVALSNIYNHAMSQINEWMGTIRTNLDARGYSSQEVNQAVNYLLPRATTTDFVIGFTPEALIHFCHKRLCRRAQEFIRRLAALMKAEVEKYNAEFAKELVPHCEFLLWCPEGKNCCGRKPTREQLEKELKGKE